MLEQGTTQGLEDLVASILPISSSKSSGPAIEREKLTVGDDMRPYKRIYACSAGISGTARKLDKVTRLNISSRGQLVKNCFLSEKDE